MEENKSLEKLKEAVDLIKMLEEITGPASFEKVSASSMAGVRITLRTVRETILNSHDLILSSLKSNAATQVEAAAQVSTATPEQSVPVEESPKTDLTGNSREGFAYRTQSLVDAPKLNISRRDLRSSLEKLVDL